MPVVPVYEADRVKLDPGMNFRDNTSVNADAFGGNIARAVGGLGEGISAYGQAQAQVQKMQAQSQALVGVQQAMAEKDRLYLGDENTQGYSSLEGKNAVDAFPDYQKKWNDAKTKIRAGITDPVAQQEFDYRVMAVDNDAQRQGLATRAAGQKSFFIGEHTSAMNGFQDQAIQSPSDENRFKTYIGNGLAEIDALGAKQGWGPERITQEHAGYVSSARTKAAAFLAQTDPIAALTYATTHKDEILPDDAMNLLEKLKPEAISAVKRDAAHASISTPAPNQFAATGLPPIAYAFLGTTAQGEAHSYDILNGGGKFTGYADHPRRVGPGGASTAAGRYQFVEGTWDRVSNKLGLPDFSPASQDKGAWYLAQADYRTRTGRSLVGDIEAGNFGAIRRGLTPTWESFGQISDAEFGRRMESRLNGIVTIGGVGKSSPDYLASAGQPTADAMSSTSLSTLRPPKPTMGDVTFSPDVEAALSGLPPAYADQLRQSAVAGVAADQAEALKAQKAASVAQEDHYKLRIATSDDTLSVNDIVEDPSLDEGQKAGLVNSYNEKNKKELEARDNIRSFANGNLMVDGYTEAGRKANDAVWDKVSSSVKPEQRMPVLGELIRQTNTVPTSITNSIRGNLDSRNPARVLDAMQMSQQIQTISQTAFKGEGGDIASKAGTDYRHMVDDLGYSPQEAVAHYLAVTDPAKQRIVDEKEVNKLTEKVNVGTVTGLFSNWHSFSPAAGFDPKQSATMVADYKELLKNEYEEVADPTIAKGRADMMFRRLYGVTNATGSSIVIKYPPENYHPPVNGSYSYLNEQLIADVGKGPKGDITPDMIHIEPAPNTAARIAAGQAPAYVVTIWRKGADGLPTVDMTKDGLGLVFDPAAAMTAAREKQAPDNQREFNVAREQQNWKRGEPVAVGADAKPLQKVTADDMPSVTWSGAGRQAVAVPVTPDERQRQADAENAANEQDRADLKRKLEEAQAPFDVLNANRNEMTQEPPAPTRPPKTVAPARPAAPLMGAQREKNLKGGK
ncbi:hypothetical protein [Pleomorphomonas oryzae]|uniref:hypothetical protein n=1 Tax=Pleomorphomonas oryzae TaxID=261934 RepID=UPI00041A62DA|nr:hypothetical protein [Pleomorphomonas oryzae]